MVITISEKGFNFWYAEIRAGVACIERFSPAVFSHQEGGDEHQNKHDSCEKKRYPQLM
jgi:hypothetical protein